MDWRRSLESIIALLVIAVVFGLVWTQIIAAEHEVRSAPPMDVGPVPVRVSQLLERSLPVELSAYGTLQPLRRVVLTSELSGRIAAVHDDWRPGAEVPAQTTLLTIDPLKAQLAIELARSQVAEAEVAEAGAHTEQKTAQALIRKTHEYLDIATRERVRMTALEETGEVSPKLADDARGAEVLAARALEEARGRLATAQSQAAAARASGDVASAALAQAQDHLARHQLLAPFAGRLTLRGPEPGAYVSPTTPLGELLDTSTLLLAASVHEDQLAGLRLGQSAEVSLPSRPGSSFEGSLFSIGSQADPITRTVEVEIRFENIPASEPGEPLQAGLFARATIALGLADHALFIARGEFSWIDGEPMAFVLGELDGTLHAEARPIVLGPPVGEGFLVEQGLSAGERIVTSPLDRMSVSAPTAVRILEAEGRQ